MQIIFAEWCETRRPAKNPSVGYVDGKDLSALCVIGIISSILSRVELPTTLSEGNPREVNVTQRGYKGVEYQGLLPRISYREKNYSRRESLEMGQGPGPTQDSAVGQR